MSCHGITYHWLHHRKMNYRRRWYAFWNSLWNVRWKYSSMNQNYAHHCNISHTWKTSQESKKKKITTKEVAADLGKMNRWLCPNLKMTSFNWCSWSSLNYLRYIRMLIGHLNDKFTLNRNKHFIDYEGILNDASIIVVTKKIGTNSFLRISYTEKTEREI